MKDLTATMDITGISAEEEEATAHVEGKDGKPASEFPGTDEAVKESLKTAGPKDTAGPSHTQGVKPPTVVVEDEPVAAPTGSAPATQPSTFEKPAHPSPSPSPAPGSGATTPQGGRRQQIPLRPALMDRASDEVGAHEDDEAKRKEKKKALSKEQREQLAAYEKERTRIRQERVNNLAEKLLSRISVWTETDKGADVTVAFKEKIRLEVEDLKMESFGLDILHAIGATYISKATAVLRSQKFFGVGGFIHRMKDKGTLVKDTWNTISSAIDAQQSMEEMARMEQEGGEEWTDEKKVEYERRVTGKILTAAWRGSKFEIQSVLREVCDAVLNDKKVSQKKRLERAEALIIVGEICAKVRDWWFYVLFQRRRC